MATQLLDSWFKMDVGEGAFYAVFGFAFVLLGIALLILIFTILGLVMKRVNARKGGAPKKAAQREREALPAALPAETQETPELVAVISAAIAAYYEGTQQKCDFVVRRIKRL